LHLDCEAVHLVVVRGEDPHAAATTDGARMHDREGVAEEIVLLALDRRAAIAG